MRSEFLIEIERKKEKKLEKIEFRTYIPLPPEDHIIVLDNPSSVSTLDDLWLCKEVLGAIIKKHGIK